MLLTEKKGTIDLRNSQRIFWLRGHCSRCVAVHWERYVCLLLSGRVRGLETWCSRISTGTRRWCWNLDLRGIAVFNYLPLSIQCGIKIRCTLSTRCTYQCSSNTARQGFQHYHFSGDILNVISISPNTSFCLWSSTPSTQKYNFALVSTWKRRVDPFGSGS